MRLAVDVDIPYIENFLEQLSAEFSWDVIKFSDSFLNNKVISECDAIFVRSTSKIDDSLIKDSRISFIGSATSGHDHIDNKYMNWTSSDKKCFVAKGCNAEAVVNYVLTIMSLLISKKEISVNDSVGIVGYGNIGSLLKQKLDMFNIKSYFYDPYINSTKKGCKDNIRDILNCDIVSLHASYSKIGHFPSHHLLNQGNLTDSKLKFLINSSRGEVVDEEYLQNQTTFKYISDVWSNEPYCSKKAINNAYLSTPHIAGYSVQAKKNASTSLIRSFCNFFNINIHIEDSSIKTNVSNFDIPEIDLIENKFPCTFFRDLFDIELCSNNFKHSYLEKGDLFPDIRKSFKHINDYSIYDIEDAARKFN